jgi:hypothetical protein
MHLPLQEFAEDISVIWAGWSANSHQHHTPEVL